MSNRSTNSNLFMASARKKFDLNLRPQRQIRHGKQAHADIAEIDANRIHMRRPGEYLDGSVQQLAFPATPVGFEAALENHPYTSEDKVTQ
jgi:hypothetical protein